jgi:hypothetical protein
MNNATSVKEWQRRRLAQKRASLRGEFLGTYPCCACGKKVRVYDWLPEGVLCVRDQREIEKAEMKQVAPDDDTPVTETGHREGR